MNKFNNSVKQNKKTIIVVALIALLALILCIASSMTVGLQKADAIPESLQQTLDQTSTAYFDALSAQEEAEAKVIEAKSTIEECEKEIPYIQNKIFDLAKYSYINRGYGAILQAFTGAQTISDLVSSIQCYNVISARNASTVQYFKELKAQVESEKTILDANYAEATAQANIAANAYQAAQNAIAEAQAAAEEAAAAQQQQQQGGGGGWNPGHTASDVANRALNEIGKPYVWGAVGPEGYDCSGLVSYAVSGSHTRIGTTTTFMGWQQLDSPVVGCVCTNWDHCGIYVGDGYMCHAPYPGRCVETIKVEYFWMIYVQC